MNRWWIATLLLSAQAAHSFQVARSLRSPTRLAVLSVDENAPREYTNFGAWANHYGLQQENGFQLTEYGGDWSVMTSQNAPKGSRVLFVPAMLVLSSKRAREEEFPGLESVIQTLEAKGAKTVINQFYLWLKVMREYELGDQSPYFPWLDAMPRRFTTAVTFDDFELSCLPPFVGSLAKIDKINLNNFLKVLPQVTGLSETTKANVDLAKWAYNVVFTRCWTNAAGECEIVPMADMLNHAADANVEVKYDPEGNCNVVMTRDAVQGEPLTLSYGNPTNLSRFLSTFGFLDQSAPATFCKIMTARPSQELKDVGYDFSRMVFYVENGAIAQEVWDVMLYQVLETNPQDRQTFYQAHMRGDQETKVQVHTAHMIETCQALLKHVDTTLATLDQLQKRMDAEGMVRHSNLPMIRQHNDFVKDTFSKVKYGLDEIVNNELARREALV